MIAPILLCQFQKQENTERETSHSDFFTSCDFRWLGCPLITLSGVRSLYIKCYCNKITVAFPQTSE